MRRGTMGMLLVACLLAGCAGARWSLPRNRPPTTPGPRNVQAEIRDARYFLAFPDRTVGPQTEMQPRNTRLSISSD